MPDGFSRPLPSRNRVQSATPPTRAQEAMKNERIGAGIAARLKQCQHKAPKKLDQQVAEIVPGKPRIPAAAQAAMPVVVTIGKTISTTGAFLEND